MGAGTGDGSGSPPGVKPGASTALLAEVAATTEHREAEPPSLLPGTVVGRFETLREPGRGGFGDLLAELKRRHVFRVMVGYGIFAFAALQVAEPLMHGLHLPDWVLTAVIAALAVGFPAALILAWVFDLTARGVRRTPSAAGPGAISSSRRRLAALLVVVAVVGALPGVGWYAWKRASDHRSASARRPRWQPFATRPATARDWTRGSCCSWPMPRGRPVGPPRQTATGSKPGGSSIECGAQGSPRASLTATGYGWRPMTAATKRRWLWSPASSLHPPSAALILSCRSSPGCSSAPTTRPS